MLTAEIYTEDMCNRFVASFLSTLLPLDQDTINDMAGWFVTV